jgi:hypothetical protein
MHGNLQRATDIVRLDGVPRTLMPPKGSNAFLSRSSSDVGLHSYGDKIDALR